MKAELLVWAWLCVSVAVIGPATGRRKYSRSGIGDHFDVLRQTPTYAEAYMGTLRCLKRNEGSPTYFFHVNGVCALFSCRVKEDTSLKTARVKPYGCKCSIKDVTRGEQVWPSCCGKCGKGGGTVPKKDEEEKPESGSTETTDTADKDSAVTKAPVPAEAGGGNATTTAAGAKSDEETTAATAAGGDASTASEEPTTAAAP